MKNLICLILLTLSTAATAMEVQTGSGQRFAVSYNEHGAVLKSFGKVIYLGKDCDAFSDGVYGMWSWANGGFVVSFPKQEFGFPRQDIEIFNDKCMM